jgi:energy-coupling factor transporter ATP-binding protein EcfA2
MDKLELLKKMTFGAQVAEDEFDQLQRYFVETDQWNRIHEGATDIVYGAKGSGKSALYALLGGVQITRGASTIAPIQAENPRGSAAFSVVVADPPTSEAEFVDLWKLYVLALVGQFLGARKAKGASARTVVGILERAGLLTDDPALPGLIRRALELVRRLRVEPSVTSPEGVTYSAPITLSEPSDAESKQGAVSIEGLLQKADLALSDLGVEAWILLDRLDVAFPDTSALEKRALRALFRVYLDTLRLQHVQLKIFIRTDIWGRITDEGFREASHIIRDDTIEWDRASLLNLVVRRLLDNDEVCAFLSVDKAVVLSSTQAQEEVFYRMFPKQIDVGAKKPSTLDWMLKRVADGKGEVAPRELIHLLNRARELQIRSIEMGAREPAAELVLSRDSIKNALEQVSEKRLRQTLFAENPELKPFVLALRGEKADQTPTTLARLWSVSEVDAVTRAEKLVEVGFFSQKGTRAEPIYSVPFLYRPASGTVQGRAKLV